MPLKKYINPQYDIKFISFNIRNNAICFNENPSLCYLCKTNYVLMNNIKTKDGIDIGICSLCYEKSRFFFHQKCKGYTLINKEDFPIKPSCAECKENLCKKEFNKKVSIYKKGHIDNYGVLSLFYLCLYYFYRNYIEKKKYFRLPKDIRRLISKIKLEKRCKKRKREIFNNGMNRKRRKISFVL